MEFQNLYAGKITYTPRITITEENLNVLRDRLIASGFVEEPENPQIVIDWLLERNLCDAHDCHKTA